VKSFTVIATVAYPLLVYLGLRLLDARELALLCAVVFIARVVAREPGRLRHLRPLAAPGLAVAIILGSTAVLDDGRFLLAAPSLVSLSLLLAFARTLRTGPTVAESFARMQHADMTAAEIAHCRVVTQAWCVFFAANAAVAAWLALFASLETWTFYTGFLAYVVMGAMFASEFVYRTWRFRRYHGSAVDPLLQRFFPPRPSPVGPPSSPQQSPSDGLPSKPVAR
jgi:uncharacterized membrane protein